MAYLEYCQTSKMERLPNIENGKLVILDVRQGSEYASVTSSEIMPIALIRLQRLAVNFDDEKHLTVASCHLALNLSKKLQNENKNLKIKHK